MEPVKLNLPADARVLFNSLYRSSNPAFLTQDVLAVRLSDGSVIDVSWYPEYDPSGAYTITRYHGSWDNQIEALHQRRDIDQVIRDVQRLARHSGVTGVASWSDPGVKIESVMISGSTSAPFDAGRVLELA
jgi:hypothetical protein